MFSCIEVELKPYKKVLSILSRYGHDWAAEGKPKIIYTSNKIYTAEETSAIFKGEWSLIKLGPFEPKHIKKIRPSITETLSGEDRIQLGLALEAYINKPTSKVIRAQKEVKKNYSVYVFRLKPEACESKLLLKHNPPKNRKSEAYYVGQTSLSIAERFDVHTNPNNPSHRKGSPVMRKFAMSSQFEDCDCTAFFAQLSGIETNDLSHYESLAHEKAMMLFIRNQYKAFSHSN
jgi:hypothetical protein